MIFIILIILVVARVCHVIVLYIVKKASENKSEDEDNIDEGLGELFDCMSGKEQKEMYATEVYNRKSLNLRSMSDESLERLRTA